MEKIDVVLVLLNSGKLKDALKKLNLDNINLAMIVADDARDADNDIDDADVGNESDAEDKAFSVNENEIPQMTFSTVYKIEKKYKDFIWLLSGGDRDALAKTKNFFVNEFTCQHAVILRVVQMFIENFPALLRLEVVAFDKNALNHCRDCI